MKDYYYFLGISTNASKEDIKKAYRKLSLKYHPDKNLDDDFFENRFREVQEAYETLINDELRSNYDQGFSSPKTTTRNTLPPYIKTFSANKIRVQKGEEVIIIWQTQNADVVKILPFGLEKSYGERAFKINEFVDGKFQLLLHAQNSLTTKTVVKGITITEIFENDKEKYRSEAEEVFNLRSRPSKRSTEPKRAARLFLMVFFAVMLLAWLLYALEILKFKR